MREQRQEEVTWISGAVEFTKHQSQDSDQVFPPAPNPTWPLGQSSFVVSSSSPTIWRYISPPILSWSPWDCEIISNRLGSYENSRTSYFELPKWPHQLRHLLWLNNGLEAVHSVSCPVQYLNSGLQVQSHVSGSHLPLGSLLQGLSFTSMNHHNSTSS